MKEIVSGEKSSAISHRSLMVPQDIFQCQYLPMLANGEGENESQVGSFFFTGSSWLIDTVLLNLLATKFFVADKYS